MEHNTRIDDGYGAICKSVLCLAGFRTPVEYRLQAETRPEDYAVMSPDNNDPFEICSSDLEKWEFFTIYFGMEPLRLIFLGVGRGPVDQHLSSTLRRIGIATGPSCMCFNSEPS